MTIQKIVRVLYDFRLCCPYRHRQQQVFLKSAQVKNESCEINLETIFSKMRRSSCRLYPLRCLLGLLCHYSDSGTWCHFMFILCIKKQHQLPKSEKWHKMSSKYRNTYILSQENVFHLQVKCLIKLAEIKYTISEQITASLTKIQKLIFIHFYIVLIVRQSS